MSYNSILADLLGKLQSKSKTSLRQQLELPVLPVIADKTLYDLSALIGAASITKHELRTLPLGSGYLDIVIFEATESFCARNPGTSRSLQMVHEVLSSSIVIETLAMHFLVTEWREQAIGMAHDKALAKELFWLICRHTVQKHGHKVFTLWIERIFTPLLVATFRIARRKPAANYKTLSLEDYESSLLNASADSETMFGFKDLSWQFFTATYNDKETSILDGALSQHYPECVNALACKSTTNFQPTAKNDLLELVLTRSSVNLIFEKLESEALSPTLDRWEIQETKGDLVCSLLVTTIIQIYLPEGIGNSSVYKQLRSSLCLNLVFSDLLVSMIKKDSFGSLLSPGRKNRILQMYKTSSKDLSDTFEVLFAVLWEKTVDEPWRLICFATEIFGPLLKHMISYLKMYPRYLVTVLPAAKNTSEDDKGKSKKKKFQPRSKGAARRPGQRPCNPALLG